VVGADGHVGLAADGEVDGVADGFLAELDRYMGAPPKMTAVSVPLSIAVAVVRAARRV
jgi:hypothetical protein